MRSREFTPESNPTTRVKLLRLTCNFYTGVDKIANSLIKQKVESEFKFTLDPIRAKKTVRGFGIKRKQVVGFKSVQYGARALKTLKLMITAVTARRISLLNNSLSFGFSDYTRITGVKYDPETPLFGGTIHALLATPGHSRRFRRRRPIKRVSIIPFEKISEFVYKNFRVDIGEKALLTGRNRYTSRRNVFRLS